MSSGVQCSVCKHWETDVTDSRTVRGKHLPNDEAYVWRRRKCRRCSNKFTTVEITVDQLQEFFKWA